jgi:hypothetical protein
MRYTLGYNEFDFLLENEEYSTVSLMGANMTQKNFESVEKAVKKCTKKKLQAKQV